MVSASQQLWVPAVAALVGVAVGGAITIFGVERQIAETRAAEERSIRADSYLTLLDSAHTYSQRTADLMTLVRTTGGAPEAVADLPASPVLGDWLDARAAFQENLNRVYVYGSEKGWKATLELAGALPYAQGNEIEFVDVAAEFSTAYREVLRVMCEEATVSPRHECVNTQP